MITHKRGDTFEHLAAIPVEEIVKGVQTGFRDGYFVGWTVTAQMRTAQYGKLLSELVCTWANPLTTRILNVKAINTTTWDIGPAEMDIQFVRTSDGTVISSNTLQVNILKDITRVQ